jgi:hypothetical protein
MEHTRGGLSLTVRPVSPCGPAPRGRSASLRAEVKDVLTLLVNVISTSENRRPFSEKHYTV